ncbi:MAG TPA: DUF1552 domain-containing protein [Polyangiaceae bacterium]|nr:DUF1552 domain-containing protein [Polyangiaceae bacterium]
MKSLRLSRRALLRGAAGTLVALPALEAMWGKNAQGQAATAPKRFVAFYSPNGTNAGNSDQIAAQTAFWPAQTGTGFVLGSEVAPLEALRDKLLIVSGIRGISMEDDIAAHGDLHSIGIAQMLSGVHTEYDISTYGKIPGANAASYGMGITLDQYLGQKIGGSTKFPTLEFGVINTTDAGVLPWSRMIYSGPNQPVPAVEDPAEMFKRMFSDGTTTGDMTVDQSIVQRKSVLDHVMSDITKLEGQLGASDKAKLDKHLTAVRDLEARLKTGPTGGPTLSCDSSTPVENAGDPQDKANFPATGKLMMDLLALVLKCDVTRVASLQWSWARSNLVHSWAGASTGHHDMSHFGGSTELSAVNAWYAAQFAYLGQSLADVQDIDGTNLLDNTVIYWGSDVAYAYTHSFLNMRAFFLGGCGGALKTGQHVNVGEQPHQKLLVTLLNAMGVAENQFGDASYGTGPLPEMMA